MNTHQPHGWIEVKDCAALKIVRLGPYGIQSDGLDLTGMDLSTRQLQEVVLDTMCLFGANLSSSNLRNASLQFSNLSHANLKNANLRGADLKAASLVHANVKKTNFFGAVFNRETKLPFSKKVALKQGMIFVENFIR